MGTGRGRPILAEVARGPSPSSFGDIFQLFIRFPESLGMNKGPGVWGWPPPLPRAHKNTGRSAAGTTDMCAAAGLATSSDANHAPWLSRL